MLSWSPAFSPTKDVDYFGAKKLSLYDFCMPDWLQRCYGHLPIFFFFCSKLCFLFYVTFPLLLPACGHPYFCLLSSIIWGSCCPASSEYLLPSYAGGRKLCFFCQLPYCTSFTVVLYRCCYLFLYGRVYGICVYVKREKERTDRKAEEEKRRGVG